MKHIKKILYVSDYYPPYTVGGAEISTSYVANIASKKYRTIVLTGEFQKENWMQDGTIVFPKMINVRINNASLINKITYLANSVYAPIYNSFNLLRLVKKEKVDLIHLVPSSYHTIPLVVASYLTGKPVIVDARNYSLLCPVSRIAGECHHHYGIKCFDCLMTSYRIEQPFLRIFKPVIVCYELFLFNLYIFFLKKFGKIHKKNIFIALSNYVHKELIDGGFPSSKIRTIYNITPTRQIESTERRNVIAFAGSLEKSKGVWDAIKGFELSGRNDFEFVIAGAGKEKEDIDNYIKKKGLGNIKLVGKITHEKVIELYSKSRIIVAPSVWPEPFGRFVLESMLTRTPMVTTKIGGIPEGITDMQTGILVEPKSPEQIADAFNKLIDNSELYETIQNNLDKKIKEYSPEKIGEERMRLYEEFLRI